MPKNIDQILLTGTAAEIFMLKQKFESKETQDIYNELKHSKKLLNTFSKISTMINNDLSKKGKSNTWRKINVWRADNIIRKAKKISNLEKLACLNNNESCTSCEQLHKDTMERVIKPIEQVFNGHFQKNRKISE